MSNKNSTYDIHSLEKSFMLFGQLDGGSGADGNGEGEGKGEGDKGGSVSTAEFEKLKAQTNGLIEENERLSAHNSKVIEEKRLETEAKRKLDEDNALKNKDFDAYKKSSDDKIKELNDRFEASTRAIGDKEVKNLALDMAGKLANGANIALLSNFIEKRLRFGERGVEIIDSKGDLSAMSISDLQAEFLNNADYSSLLKGTDSSGGGANGNANNNGAGGKTLSRAELAALSPQAQADHFKKDKGQVID